MDIPFLASIFGRHEFVVRRVHSLLGLVPIGGFLCFHLATNASILDGSETFQMRVNIIHQLGPITLSVLEWGTIFLPILLHGIIGLIIVSRGKRNLRHYPYLENWRYACSALRAWRSWPLYFFTYFRCTAGFAGSGGPTRRPAVWRGAIQLGTCHGVGRGRACRIENICRDLLYRHCFGRVSLGQRAVDDGHYLGRLDHSTCPALGEYPVRVVRLGIVDYWIGCAIWIFERSPYRLMSQWFGKIHVSYKHAPLRVAAKQIIPDTNH